MTLTASSSLDASQSSVVFLDDETNLLSYTPTRINDSSVTFKHKNSGVFSVVRGKPAFSDIGSHWAKNDITTLAGKSIVRGRGTNAFDPKQPITRAEFAEFIARGLGLRGDRASASSYRDAMSSPTASSYIGAVSALGIVKGNSSGFQPNAPVSRQEMAAMMVRAVEASEVKVILPQPNSSYLSKFKDKNKISSWAQPFAAKAVFMGIVSGQKADAFGPSGQATRAEAVIMVKRMLQYLGMLDV